MEETLLHGGETASEGGTGCWTVVLYRYYSLATESWLQARGVLLDTATFTYHTVHSKSRNPLSDRLELARY